VFTIAGDLNLKYLFGSGALRPYVMGGAVVRVAGASASIGHPFAGGGLYILGRTLQFYISYLFWNEEAIQIGFGLPL